MRQKRPLPFPKARKQEITRDESTGDDDEKTKEEKQYENTCKKHDERPRS